VERVQEYPRIFEILKERPQNFPGTKFWKGFGNTQEDVFISCFECKAQMHLFLMWFSRHGWFLLLTLISKTVGWLPVLLMYYSRVSWKNKFFGVLERTHCWKSVDVVICYGNL
jgi:hypothetical protein